MSTQATLFFLLLTVAYGLAVEWEQMADKVLKRGEELAGQFSEELIKGKYLDQTATYIKSRYQEGLLAADTKLGDSNLRDPNNSDEANKGCAINKMPKDKSTLVLTDKTKRGTQCIFGDDYGYQVIPGDSDKLLFYFQGGGACWNEASTRMGLCSTNLGPSAPAGIFDKSNKKNPFKDYTIVQALYCSGDLHSGNVTQPYKLKAKTESVIQVGYLNTLTIVDWLKQNIADGNFGTNMHALQSSGGSGGTVLSDLVVMGCSAGSLGTQIWAKQLVETFPAKLVAIVPDSYLGVLPDGIIGPLIKGFGICSTILMPDSLIATCNEGSLDVVDLVKSNMQSTPKIPWSFIQSKVDAVQQSFYIALAITTPPYNGGNKMAPKIFYKDALQIMEGYNSLPNFVAFLVDGPMHCFTNMDIFYKATGYGPEGHRGNREKNKHYMAPERSDTLKMVDWVGSLPLQANNDHSGIASQCVGQMVPLPTSIPKSSFWDVLKQLKSLFSTMSSYWTLNDSLQTNEPTDEAAPEDGVASGNRNGIVDYLTYCDETLYPKKIVQQ